MKVRFRGLPLVILEKTKMVRSDIQKKLFAKCLVQGPTRVVSVLREDISVVSHSVSFTKFKKLKVASKCHTFCCYLNRGYG